MICITNKYLSTSICQTIGWKILFFSTTKTKNEGEKNKKINKKINKQKKNNNNNKIYMVNQGFSQNFMHISDFFVAKPIKNKFLVCLMICINILKHVRFLSWITTVCHLKLVFVRICNEILLSYLRNMIKLLTLDQKKT